MLGLQKQSIFRPNVRDLKVAFLPLDILNTVQNYKDHAELWVVSFSRQVAKTAKKIRLEATLNLAPFAPLRESSCVFRLLCDC
jgi:hypothetical protein